ncbi:MAG TPA: hypothetical protein VFP30_07240 [Candidatus Limnocylindria bacterium]|nr:hypothetical protein [Candidatus Limnocylindria bacterium]
MSATKRPSTSSLRRYLTSRPYIAVADIRRRFGLDPDAMSVVSRNGTTAFIGLPEREATKLQDLWQRDEVGVELSVEVRAPVVVGVYPIRIARFVLDHATNGNGYHPAFPESHQPEPMRPAPIYRPEPVHPQPMRAEDASEG